MANILPIVLHPHAALRQQAEAVDNMSGDVRTTLHDMLETIHVAHGIGLAGPQVRLPKRLVAIHIPHDEDVEPVPTNEPLLMANPEIIAHSEEMIDSEEGCLSIPLMYDIIPRRAWVKVAYVDANGDPREIESDGLMGRCLQHEIDHLDGVLFSDHLSRLKRDLLLKKYRRIYDEFEETLPYPFLKDDTPQRGQ